MKNENRMKIIAICIGAIFAQIEAGTALADSAVGVDTALGNALNPPGRSSIPREVDPDGVDAVRRSPTGQLYGVPLAETESAKKQDSWNVSGGVEAGALLVSPDGKLGSKNAAQFRQYKDLHNGPYLNYFEVDAEKPDTASFFQAFGGGVANSDQFFGLQFGRLNDWKVKTFYNETLHVFTDSWKSLFTGEGTGTMTIAGVSRPNMVTGGSPTVGTGACTAAAPCWSYGGQVYSNATAAPAANTAAVPLWSAINGVQGTSNPTTGALITGNGQSGMAKAINDKLASTAYSELALIRKKGGARGDLVITDNLKGYASYTLEKRQGSRPYAANDGNISFEIAEPIDYDTHDLMVGLSYADDKSQANLRATASSFRNNISTLNVQLPLLTSATPMGAINTATLDLAPNNDAVNVKGEFARNFPEFYKSRFTVAASYGVNKENDALLAPISAAQNADLIAAGINVNTANFVPSGTTANPGYAPGTGLISNWNTAAALSRQSAGQEIDNKMVDLGFSLKPVNDLNVKTSYHYFATDNKGGYVAYNPLTGQFGRGPSSNQGLVNFELLVAPGGGSSCYAPAGFAVVAACQVPTVAAAAGSTAIIGTQAALANGSNVPVFGQARSTKQSNFAIAADYDLTRTRSVNFAVEREEFNRNFRERENTWENKLKLGYVDRSMGIASLRTSIEKDVKRGSEYRYRTWEDLGTGLPGLDIATQTAFGVAAANLNLNNNGTPNTASLPANVTTGSSGAYIVNGLIVYKNTSLTATPTYNGVKVSSATAAGANYQIIGAVGANGVVYAVPAASIWTRYSTMMRKYDQADRDQVIFNTRLNLLARDDLDVGLNGQVKRVNYTDSYYGLKEDNQNSVGFDFNFQPSATLSLSGYYNYQKGSKVQSLNSGTAVTLPLPCITTTTLTQSQAVPAFTAQACADTSGGSTGARPDSSAWTSRSDDTNNVIGLGMMNDFGFVRLGVDYTFAQSRTKMEYSFNSTALAAAPSDALIALAGSALPDMTTVQNTIVVNLIKPINKMSSVRLLYRYEEMRIADWHYDSVITNAMAAYDGQTLLTDSGPQRYSASVTGLMYQLKF
jgi:hypothetical protein